MKHNPLFVMFQFDMAYQFVCGVFKIGLLVLTHKLVVNGSEHNGTLAKMTIIVQG